MDWGHATDDVLSEWRVGSGWSEYKKSGNVHGIPLPAGLVESQKLPEPLFTPSTKAEQGQHDENISPTKGPSVCLSVSSLANPF